LKRGNPFTEATNHIRIGSFQRLATLGETENLKRLTDYALKHYYGEDAGDDAPQRLLLLVAERTARLAASYMAAGFVHGVLNTDNINISGESFDYGPWRWTPIFDPAFTAAYFDEQGLYAFGRQPEAIHWNVVQLAIALTKIADQDKLVDAVNAFEPAYRRALVDRMLWRLGVLPRGPEADTALITSIEQALIQSGQSIDQFYFDWSGGRLRKSAAHPDYDSVAFEPLKALISSYQPARTMSHDYWKNTVPCAMPIETVEGIWAPIAASDDWTLFEQKIQDIRLMGDALKQMDQ
jgi:serine/tyrosine/threonine adenylyltransferase